MRYWYYNDSSGIIPYTLWELILDYSEMICNDGGYSGQSAINFKWRTLPLLILKLIDTADQVCIARNTSIVEYDG